MITVPLDKSGITNETQLASDLGGVSSVGRILFWDPTLGGTGGYYSYDPTDPESDTFAVDRIPVLGVYEDKQDMASVALIDTVQASPERYMACAPKRH